METILAALIAALAALGGVLLERYWQSKADARSWEHDETTRRRARGEEVAREARRALLEAAALFDESWIRASGRPSKWEGPPDKLIEKATERAMDSSIEVPDDDIRLFVRNAVTALRCADDANQAGYLPPWEIARAVAAETDAVIGAYLRGERLPPATEVERTVLAAGAWRAELDAYQAEKQAEWQQRRAHRAKAKAEAEVDGPAT